MDSLQKQQICFFTKPLMCAPASLQFMCASSLLTFHSRNQVSCAQPKFHVRNQRFMCTTSLLTVHVRKQLLKVSRAQPSSMCATNASCAQPASLQLMCASRLLKFHTRNQRFMCATSLLTVHVRKQAPKVSRAQPSFMCATRLLLFHGRRVLFRRG